MSSRFENGYYTRQYRDRPWRRRGDRPVVYRTLLRTLSPWSGGRLLDVGCGEGHFLRRSAKCFEPHGIDISAEGVSSARQNTGLSAITEASAEEMPFDGESFEVVTCLDVFEHLVRPERCLSEIQRVLTSGGCVVISTPNPSSFGHRVKRERSFIYRDPTHISIKSIESWRELIRAQGLQVIRDGTDTLWDAPYYSRLPRVQWLGFLSLSYAMWAFRLVYPWRLGENYVCIAIKP